MSRSTLVRAIAAMVVLSGLWGGLMAPHAGAKSWLEVGGTAVVTTTDGDVLALRIGPGVAYSALTAFVSGTDLQVLDGPMVDDTGIPWYQVASGGLVGWSAGIWLAPPTVTSGTRYIGGSDGGVRLRDDPGLSGEIVQIIPEGGAVVLLGASRYADELEWALVRYGTTSGWAASIFLGGVSAGGGGEAVAPAPPTAAAPGPPIGGYARVVATEGYDLRVRDGIGLNAPIYGVIPPDAVVTVVNGPLSDESGAPWYGINYDGLLGWVLGEHLESTATLPSRRIQAGEGRMSAYTGPPAVSNPARGRAIVAEALRHLGTPYVWGGDGPAGWDCSGMIQWVYRQVTGISIPRVSQDQFRYGASLRPDQIEAGDIIFFFDTDGPGITHNGIALGDGRFIHARDESRGTVISRLDEPLWTAHYAGARRP